MTLEQALNIPKWCRELAIGSVFVAIKLMNGTIGSQQMRIFFNLQSTTTVYITPRRLLPLDIQ